MELLQKRVEQLDRAIKEALSKISYEELKAQLKEFNKLSVQPEFWQDAAKAAEISKKLAALDQRLKPWDQLVNNCKEISELIGLSDPSLATDIEKQLVGAENDFEALKKELRYSGPYDSHDAILGIYAGAGGTDAQDWAAMLLRMYLRWIERQGFKVNTVAESAGEEAGIKSVIVEVSGNLAFGKLKNEHGVHRLVRLSPFNADSLRQTSFAKVEVLPKIEQTDAEIEEKDLKIDVYRSGGHGGQSVNTTDSAVRITHIPSGITVSIQNERSQLQNKETAMTILRSRLVQMQMEQHLEKLADIKGVNQSAEWGNQIRSYVLHPYKMVKDLRTNVETSDTEAVLNGEIDLFIDSF